MNPKQDDKSQKKEKPGTVYLFSAVGVDRYKIGATEAGVQGRLKQLQTGSPMPLECVFQVFVADAFYFERQLHLHFANKREIGEWFTLDGAEVNECIHLMVAKAIPRPLDIPSPLMTQEQVTPLITLLKPALNQDQIMERLEGYTLIDDKGDVYVTLGKLAECLKINHQTVKDWAKRHNKIQGITVTIGKYKSKAIAYPVEVVQSFLEYRVQMGDKQAISLIYEALNQ